MEQILMELGLKDGLFAGLFLYLLISQTNANTKREDKLYNFLDEMKGQFSKLVGSYERLTQDVTEIREEITDMKSERKG